MGKLAEYLRISLEDMNKQHRLADESQSVANQRKMIQSFVAQNQELCHMEIVEFLDDGYTGTNFNRPQLKAMLEAAKRGEIDCIVVKDLSRFGRNYIEVGDYLEHIFPFFGVRFISINDNYDSNDYLGKTGGMDVAFRNFIYDSYSKDLSGKVRSAMRMRMEQGRFVNHTPYGYIKSTADKHKMIPDPDTAPVVRDIFLMAIAGRSTSEIAKELNTQGILTPMEYKRHRLRPVCAAREIMWSHITVLNILHNYKYTGAMTNHTRESRYMRDRNQRRVPKSEWIITEGAHEPIVSHDEYEAANQAIRHVKYEKHKTHDTSDRVFFCGHCGRKLRKTFGLDTYFSCDTPSYQEDASCRHVRWSKTDLEEVLLPIYQTQLILLEQKASASHSKTPDTRSGDIVRLLAQLERSMAACDNEKLNLYERYREGQLTRTEFIEKKAQLDARKNHLKEEHTQSSASLSKVEQEQIQFEQEMKDVEHYLNGLSTAPEQIVHEMYAAIDRVSVFDNEHISVRWKFEDLFAKMGALECQQQEMKAV